MIMMNKNGFTLIELLVVISIISLLSSVVLASLNDARGKARDAQRIQQLKQVQAALELYYSENGEYPSGNPQGMCLGWATPLTPLVSGGFLGEIPLDPTNTDPYCFNYTGPTASDSSWRCAGVRRSDYAYSLVFALENSSDSFVPVTSGYGATHCILGEKVK
jgi:type II secretion system protein G